MIIKIGSAIFHSGYIGETYDYKDIIHSGYIGETYDYKDIIHSGYIGGITYDYDYKDIFHSGYIGGLTHDYTGGQLVGYLSFRLHRGMIIKVQIGGIT